MLGSNLIDKAVGYAKSISRASQDIRVNNAQERIAKGKLVMDSNKAIGGEARYVPAGYSDAEAEAIRQAARDSFSTDSYLQGTRKVIDDRKAGIVEKQRAAGAKSEWLAKDGYLQRAASLFYSGDTGKLSKMRIAGVGAGVAGTGYAAFGGSNKRY
jgi:hypothetical protein